MTFTFALPQPTVTHTTPARPDRPAPVTIDQITATSARISWVAPDDGGSSITSYRMRYRVVGSGGAGWVVDDDATSPATITGLTPATDYQAQVRATNNVGNSQNSVNTGFTTADAHEVDAGAVTFAFALPQPTVTHAITTQEHAVNAGNVSWSFALPSPTFTLTPPAEHEVNGGDIAWTFTLPEPTVTHTEPIDDGMPTISGTAEVGETLTANQGSIADVDGLPTTAFPTGYTFQWLQDGVPIVD